MTAVAGSCLVVGVEWASAADTVVPARDEADARRHEWSGTTTVHRFSPGCPWLDDRGLVW